MTEVNETQAGKSEMKTAAIRRNQDGQQNLTDLRKALAETSHSVYRQGDNWIVSQNVNDIGHLWQAPYWYSERQAIQKALGLEVETKDQAAMWA